MGGGRKTETVVVGEATGRSGDTVNYSGFRSRNLRKSDLGGVIFGCKHSTISECLSKQLFGLPGSHFVYVRNIEPGLPLFLFNYSDRMLHGVYEAAGSGQLNLDPYAWTEDGDERTLFPSQVRICIKTYCQPIPEKKFESVIKDNYFLGRHFYFELDHMQVQVLKSLFKPTIQASIPSMPSMGTAKNFSASSSNDKFMDNFAMSWKDAVIQRKESKSAVGVVAENRYASLRDDEDNISATMSKTSGGDTENDDAKTSDGEGHENKEPVSDWEDLCSAEGSLLPPDSVVADSGSQMDPKIKQVEDISSEKARIMGKLQKLTLPNASQNFCANGPCVSCSSEGPTDLNKHLEDISGEQTMMPTCQSTEVVATTSFVQEVRDLRARTMLLEKKQFESEREVVRLRDIVKDSCKMVQQLKERVKELELKLDPSMALVEESLNASLVDRILGSEKLIYLIGGYDGHSWLNGLDSYSPSLDILTPLRSMRSPRSYAAAAALDGQLFIFGGGHEYQWYNTAECYDPRNDEWHSCPSLVREKGCLAGATLNEKIFAIGGGDGKNSFSDVEMFDPILGKWVSNPSMLQKRFAPAAAAHNGSLYAVGGYDGKDYLNSAERFDPREISWTKLPSMESRRGSHSLVVFNEKLYALGGFDGDKTVSSVEVFDPRAGAWMMGEPMNIGRGYASTAVLGDSFLVLGGIKDSESLVDVVECYREGVGWTDTDLKAIGNRCFFSALVL